VAKRADALTNREFQAKVFEFFKIKEIDAPMKAKFPTECSWAIGDHRMTVCTGMNYHKFLPVDRIEEFLNIFGLYNPAIYDFHIATHKDGFVRFEALQYIPATPGCD
jgi:hypothetical protein